MENLNFKIAEFTNLSGSKAWQLSCTLNGKRIRENRKLRAKAVSQHQVHEVENLKGASEGQTIWTRLTHDQNQVAIAAVNILKRTYFWGIGPEGKRFRF
jgi:hypothetical protein